MIANELLKDASRRGIKLWVDGDRLRLRTPGGALTPELHGRIHQHKEALLELLRRPAGRGAQAPQLTIVPAPQDRHLPFPITDIQQAYWIGRSPAMEMGGVGCHVYWEIDCRDLDIDRLSRAWARLVERHDMLRAVILPSGQQQILEPGAGPGQAHPFSIAVVDLRDRTPDALQAALGELRREMSHRVYDPAQWPLFDLRAARTSGEATRLFVSFDFLIMDGASINRLLTEWRELYRDPARDLPKLELTFRDYALAEAALQGSAEARASESYWMGRLPTLPAGPELPLVPLAADRPPRFVRRTGRLSAADWERLTARAIRAGLTPPGLLCAAYAEVLAAWSGSPRFSLVLTLFRRRPLHPQVHAIVGDFTTTLLLAAQAEAGPFEERAQRLQARLDEDLQHPDVSGVKLVRELNRLQGGLVPNGFPFVFTSLLGHGQDDGLPTSWLGEIAYAITQTPQVGLDFQVWLTGGDLIFNWDAREDAFPAGLLDDMFEALGRILRRLAVEEASWQEPRAVLVPVPERQLARRAQANETGAPISAELLHGLFARRAAEQPECPAVIAAGRIITYGELAERSRRIGRMLRGQGVRPGSLVAVVMESGWEQAAAVLGILAAGGAYTPISPNLPPERIDYLFNHGGIDFALTQARVEPRLAWPARARRLRVDDDATWAAFEAGPLDPVQRPEDLAYVIYTSGSTGLPKGVAIDHRGAVNTILDVNRRFGVGPADRVLALSSLSFDLSVYDLFGLLAAGGAVVVPDDARNRDPAHWSELVERHRVTIWNSVPALVEMWVEHLTEQAGAMPAALRLVLMSGDWIPITLPERLRTLRRRDERSAPIELISMGGATEASIWSILYPIGPVDPSWKSIPYGKPMVNQRFHVLDAALDPCPDWIPGDLYIGGVGVAMGYWRDEERTRASFLVHPRTGERLYRTGDTGRYLPDGNIEFLGRNDGQVKVGGHRIELGEIESALAQHPRVAQAVVLAKGQQRGQKRLNAYVVLAAHPASPSAEGATGDAPDELGAMLREFLLSKLPDYMVPATFTRLAALPLSATGKVDRRALLAHESAAEASSAPFVAPSGAVEERLAELAREIFKVDQVGARQNFFELGASSVQMIQLANRVQQIFGRKLTSTDAFRYPTIGALATLLHEPAEAPAAPAFASTRSRIEARRASRSRRGGAKDAQ